MNDNELDRTCGLTDDELTERFREAIRIDNEIKRVKGLPISVMRIISLFRRTMTAS